jgi:uncharacterized protein (DUF2252 family)
MNHSTEAQPTSERRRRTSLESHHLTPAERVARGRALRREVPRRAHAAFEPAPDRPDPIALLESQAASRVQDLVPIRYGRMLVSPFTFYRGAALVMASDLAGTPRTGITVQCCGDAHLTNFGAFASRDRRLVFDINDFDETLPGPWEWDVKRLAASMLIAARDNGFGRGDQDSIVRQTVAGYRDRMALLARMRVLDVWYRRTDLEQLWRERSDQMGRIGRRNVKRNVARARTRDHLQAFSKLTEIVGTSARFRPKPPLIVPLRDFPEADRAVIEPQLAGSLRSYRRTLQHDRRVLLDQFEMVDLARKVVGVGSVGTDAWMALLLGRDDRDPVLLQIKEAQPSVLERFVGKSAFRSCGERVVAGQRITQSSADMFLGWMTMPRTLGGGARDYYVRQLRDWKGSVEVEAMSPRSMGLYGQVCGEVLARSHARSGDSIALSTYIGRGEVFGRAILEFSLAYAEQNDRDYAALQAAASSGRIAAQTEA